MAETPYTGSTAEAPETHCCDSGVAALVYWTQSSNSEHGSYNDMRAVLEKKGFHHRIRFRKTLDPGVPKTTDGMNVPNVCTRALCKRRRRP
jgi:hypothetical protein